MHVAFCSSEVFPFAKTGGLADVCGALPLALEHLRIKVSVFLPYYSFINKHCSVVNRISDDVFQTQIGKGVNVYLLKNDAYFDRDGIYGDDAGDYPDNLDRFKYYGCRVLEVLKELDLDVNIIHCHDWHAALIPVYLKEQLAGDRFYAGIKTVLTIHNLAFQGLFPAKEFKKLGLDNVLFDENVFEFYGQVNLLKAGLIYSDVVTTVSPRYAQEIQTKAFGCGLEKELRGRREGIIGIINGMDYTAWNPAADAKIDVNYTKNDVLDGKKANKAVLQTKTDLLVNEDTPVFGFVGRITHQKGMDLIVESLAMLSRQDAQFIILGVGDKKYYAPLQKAVDKYPGKFAVCLAFEDRLAHQIYAGSDFFLMPSQFEPCGLGQMISMRYGTLPLVYHTGGLADTVKPGRNGNGFMFQRYKKTDFVKTVKQAVGVYQDKNIFDRLRTQALRTDFSWDVSAGKYEELYRTLC